MIIECPACRTRFRLDETKIKGRGARVRCRRCGEPIMVLKPEEPQAAAAKEAGEGFLDLRSVIRESMEEKPEEAPPEPSLPAGLSGGKDEVDVPFGKYLATSGTEKSSPAEEEKESAKHASEKKAQIGTGDRSEKIRTYNILQDRITDHRIKKSWHNIEKIFDGDLDSIVEAFQSGSPGDEEDSGG